MTKDITKHLLVMTAFFLACGCFMGVSMPHGQKPGIIVGVNLR